MAGRLITTVLFGSGSRCKCRSGGTPVVNQDGVVERAEWWEEDGESERSRLPPPAPPPPPREDKRRIKSHAERHKATMRKLN